ncbi:pleckstrin homology domain-containing family G member 4B-like isoform X3 [Dreissena polymorpha]|uniref:pleckstrin homology domain-containing family G member 4B-like isoform X3 n=1 Tax=Dreissena polymorpha TaxID=45954 RepID=UPI0022642473|nr:pleckstrin homology domain-containing family G member 4B-like isoform X3 [Dreissena polymorpha]
MSRGIFRFTGMIVDLSISISDNFWNYLWAREPAPDVEQTTCIDQSKSVDYDGLLECLKKAYGEQAIYVQKQAVALLRNRYRGNISRFMTDFLMPALEMLILLQEKEQSRILQNSYPGNQLVDEKCAIQHHKAGCKNAETYMSWSLCHICGNIKEFISESCDNPTVCDKCDKWPVVCKSYVVLHLSPISRDKLKSGDFYFYVKVNDSTKAAELWVQYCNSSGKKGELKVPTEDFGYIFTMDWKSEMRSADEDLGDTLRDCLTTLEESIHRLKWQEILPTMGNYTHSGVKLKQSSIHCSVMEGDRVKNLKDQQNNCMKCVNRNNSDFGNNFHGPMHHTVETTKSNSGSPDQRGSRSHGLVSTDGREMDNAKSPRSPRSPGLHQHRHLEPPKTILDVDYQLLKSGVAILPGARDLDGNAVVLIFTNSSLWKNQLVASTDFARLIMYYYSVPRETVRCRGFTVVADIRGCTASIINTLLESLYLFEGNTPGSISVVHLLSDRNTQSLVLKSPIYDVRASFQINILLSPALLCSYISADQLPPALEGTFQYNHDDWIRFHMRLDPFLASCRAVGRYLVNVIQELSVVEQVPASAKEASHLVNHHENLVRATFEDPRVTRLQQEGDAMLQSLVREEVNIGHTDDYRYGMEDITRLYRHVHDTISRLMRLSDTRINRLEKCLQLKDFDEECSKIISWLHTQGNECLQRHLAMADNLKGIRQQQKDFEKFYFAAMSHIEKGNDLLEEASVLAQSGDFDEVTGYKELAKMLKRHLQQFSERLEEARERIEGTTKCYQLLDKTYEWALEAMKYVASMKMEHCATPEGLEKLLKSLELYLQEHPPIVDDTFSQMSDLAKQLNNDKLLDQCLTAQNRCLETQKMLQLRGKTLQQFRDQLEQDASASATRSSASLNINTNQRTSHDFPKYSSHSAVSQFKSDINQFPSHSGGKPSWDPKDFSTPVVPKTYSRTQLERVKNSSSLSLSSSSTSSPSHSIASPSSSSITSSSPCHSTETSPLHSYSQTQASNERVSHDQNKDSEQGTYSMKNSVLSGNTDHYSEFDAGGFLVPSNTVQQRSKKQFKGAISPLSGSASSPAIVEEDSGGRTVESDKSRIASLRQNGRTDSIITGSSDSLPSLPEDDESPLLVPQVRSKISRSATTEQPYVRREWTPVPVNSHLTYDETLNTPVRPLADLKLSEEEIKSRRTLTLIMSEMIQTERDYVCSLQFIVDHYIPEMEREDVPQMLRGKRNVIFGNVEKIYAFHQQYFLQELEASRRNPFLIARYFLMHESQFYLYALYNKNKPKADVLMAEYGKMFFREKQLELGDKMDLASYLLKPVQRMGKYALLIKQILKECPKTAPEYGDLRAAEEMVRFQLRHGNDLLAMDSLRECDVSVNLPEQGKLLRQDEFLVYHGRRKFMRHVFLFEDLVLFSKTRRSRSGFQDTYIYKFGFKMSDIGLTQDYEGSGYKFEIWWRRRNTGESYVLQASSSEQKKAWVKDMTRVLWNQAIRNRENRLSELATMGIGNKPCLDIKPSSDNIQDRFINLPANNREARTRNSIAVCSVDHLRQGNKRPHSIISISSNSSSNSSQSGFNAMNLALNPVDSPRTYRRSLTFMSSESGIGTSIASGADFEPTLKGDLSDLYRTQSPPPYDFNGTHPLQMNSEREFGKPRVINLPSHAEEVTDI